MKVIQILPELNAGGVEKGSLEIAEALVRQGHESIVISNGGRLVQALEQAGSRHIKMPVHRKSILSLLQIRKVRKVLIEEKPDILHIRSRVPGWIAFLAWRKMNPKTRPHLVTTVHGFYSTNFYSAIMTKGERVIAVSSSIKTYILQNYTKTPENIIRVIYRGLKLENYGATYQADHKWLLEWQSDHPELQNRLILLLPGRITRLKGHEDFFRLIASLKQHGEEVHGLIAGDTHPKKRGYLDELKGLVRKLGIDDRITFLGHRSDIREIMSVSNIVCALSQKPESFGRTILEALALGKPVVGYDCGGGGELLNALFPEGRVPLKNVDALVKAAHNVIKKGTLPASVGDTFSLESMCQNTIGVYQELVS